MALCGFLALGVRRSGGVQGSAREPARSRGVSSPVLSTLERRPLGVGCWTEVSFGEAGGSNVTT